MNRGRPTRAGCGHPAGKSSKSFDCCCREPGSAFRQISSFITHGPVACCWRSPTPIANLIVPPAPDRRAGPSREELFPARPLPTPYKAWGLLKSLPRALHGERVRDGGAFPAHPDLHSRRAGPGGCKVTNVAPCPLRHGMDRCPHRGGRFLARAGSGDGGDRVARPAGLVAGRSTRPPAGYKLSPRPPVPARTGFPWPAVRGGGPRQATV